MGVVWFSLDPSSGEVNFYPTPIARKLETSYRRVPRPSSVALGSDFYDATIHFGNSPHQTTPEIRGRAGLMKPAGFRSVSRTQLSDDQRTISVFVLKTSDGWRILSAPRSDALTRQVNVPVDMILGDSAQVYPASTMPVIWQWCETVSAAGLLLHSVLRAPPPRPFVLSFFFFIYLF